MSKVCIHKKQKGFTLIELMVSTVVFSLVLMAATVALVQISRLYYRGVVTSRTQETSRAVSDEITQSIQFSAQAVRPPNYPSGASTFGPDITHSSIGNGNDTFYFCIGPKRYSFALDRKLSSNSVPGTTDRTKRHVLWVDTPATGCAEAAGVITPATLTDAQPTPDGRELLEENMRISKLELIPAGDSLWTLNLTLAYGDEDFFAVNNGRKVCEGSRIGVELCATSELSSTVLRRVQ